MRHKVKKNRINRPKAQRELLLGNLATDLIQHGKIKTTKAKAKALQPVIDRLITVAKKDNQMLAIRSISKYITTKASSKKLLLELAPKYAERNGGFTRISEVGFRSGDNAPMAIIELV